MPIIEYPIPYQFEARPYQLPLLRAVLIDKKRFAVCVWHRRAGKDKTCINLVIYKMLERVGLYVYLFPELKQARRTIWSGRDKTGFKFIDHFPPHLIKSVNNTEMKIELLNGSVFQLLGSDTYNSLMGFNPIGVIFSEFSLTNPLAWEYIRPILAENEGWCIFQGTPRGENHFYDLYQNALRNPSWYADMLTVRETGVISDDEIDNLRKSGMLEEFIQQEFYCSFTSSNVGSYYGGALDALYQNKQIAPLTVDRKLPVHTAWDIGYGDATAIWFFQFKEGKFYLVHYYENTQVGLAHYSDYIQRFARDRNIQYGIHFAPHDAKVHEWGSGKTRFEIALKEFGIRFKIVPDVGLINGIESVLSLFYLLNIDPVECKVGLNAIRSYSRKWDNEKKIFSKDPEHNFSSHGADALRYLCVGWKDYMGEENTAQIRKLAPYSH